jgi:ribose transport system substrate-binding protein
MKPFPDVKIISLPAMQWEASNAGTIVADQMVANPDIDLIFVHAAHLCCRGGRVAGGQGQKPGDVLLVSSNGAPVGLDSSARDGSKSSRAAAVRQAAALVMFADKVVNKQEIKPGQYNVLRS